MNGFVSVGGWTSTAGLGSIAGMPSGTGVGLAVGESVGSDVVEEDVPVAVGLAESFSPASGALLGGDFASSPFLGAASFLASGVVIRTS